MTIAIWTNDDDSVRRKHYRPDEVDTTDADYFVESDGEHPSTAEPYFRTVEYYTDSSGFQYETINPLEGVTLSDEEQAQLNEAVESGDSREVDELIRKFGGEY